MKSNFPITDQLVSNLHNARWGAVLELSINGCFIESGYYRVRCSDFDNWPAVNSCFIFWLMGLARHFFSPGSRQEVNSTWYPEIEEPIKSREKHYSLVLYILKAGYRVRRSFGTYPACIHHMMDDNRLEVPLGLLGLDRLGLLLLVYFDDFGHAMWVLVVDGQSCCGCLIHRHRRSLVTDRS